MYTPGTGKGKRKHCHPYADSSVFIKLEFPVDKGYLFIYAICIHDPFSLECVIPANSDEISVTSDDSSEIRQVKSLLLVHHHLEDSKKLRLN